MSEETRRAVERRQDHRPSAVPPARHDRIRERLDKLARTDELLRQIGYLKPDTTTAEDDDGRNDD